MNKYFTNLGLFDFKTDSEADLFESLEKNIVGKINYF